MVNVLYVPTDFTVHMSAFCTCSLFTCVLHMIITINNDYLPVQYLLIICVMEVHRIL